jgi:inhibitor of cysteine peptidase
MALALLAGCAPAQPRLPTTANPTAQPVNLPATPTPASAKPELVPVASLVMTDAGRTIYLQKGECFAITLESNPSTGYAWEIVPVEKSILTLVIREDIQSKSGLLGASGQVVLVFEAAANGRETLQLLYRRSWEKDVPPVNSFELNMVVGGQTPTSSPSLTPDLRPTPTTVVFPASGKPGWQTYTNKAFGFSFQYPADWKLSEGKGTLEGHSVLLSPAANPKAQLRIAFKRAGEDLQLGRTGMGEGDIALLGKVMVAGKEIQRNVLVFQGKHMTVNYFCRGCMQRGGLEFAFDLDYLGGWADPAALTAEVEALADLVVASIK